MKREFIAIIVLSVLIISFFAWVNNLNKSEEKVVKDANNTTSPTTSPVHFTATFEIYTRGTKRIFTDSKYHNLSKDVYITSPETNIVHIWKSGITWGDFFSTLPMEITDNCLTTGTNQKFCTNEKETLKFFINGLEFPKALDTEIRSNDKLLVIYE